MTTHQIVIALLIIVAGLLADRVSANRYRSGHRRIPGSHRSVTAARAPAGRLAGLHRTDMAGKAQR